MTSKRWEWSDTAGFLVLLESTDGVVVALRALPRRTWHRAVRFVRCYGVEDALDMINHRAEVAAEKSDYATSARWRTLITAIHAMTEPEFLPGERVH
jgi:hypothetical protein